MLCPYVRAVVRGRPREGGLCAQVCMLYRGCWSWLRVRVVLWIDSSSMLMIS